MYSKRLSAILMIKMALLLPALPAMVGCGGGSGGNNTNDNGGGGPADFDELVTTTKTQSADLNQATYDFAVAYQGLVAVSENTPAQEAAGILDRFIDSGEDFEAAVASYDELIQNYVDVVNASTSARTSSQNIFLFRGVTAAIDPPVIDVPIGVSNAIQSARDAAAACAEQYPNAATDDFEFALLEQCKKQAALGELGSTATWGVGAVLAGGAGVIIGGALSVVEAPVLIVVGGGIAAGVVVGVVWTWCTSSGSSQRIAYADGDFCIFNSAEGQVVELPDGSKVVSVLLPPGHGSLVIQGPNGPVILETTIPENGVTVDLSGCTSSTSTFSAADAAACNDLVTTDDNTNGNDNGNGNDNTNDNGNDNANDNENDNTNDNGNDNDNTNDNGNGNDNGSDGGVVDPAPNDSTPGEFGCEGCPDSDVNEFEVVEEDSSRTFAGTVTGADGNGEFYVQGQGGEAIGGTIPTDSETGAYSFTVPLFCGEQLVKCVWSNAAGSYVLVTRVVAEDCVTADIRITLTWDGLGRDWELHLIKPGGRINDDATDCTWTSCISQSPDWGVPGDTSDDPSKDVDNTGFYGPENIFLANPESGTYTVLVEHWGSGDPSSDGQVVFNVDGQTVTVSMQDLAPREVWTAGTIEWPSGTVVTSTAVFDCAENWSSGCQADIP